MVIAFVLFSIVTGGMSAVVAALAWDAGLVGALLAYWLGGMAGATILIVWAALRPETPCDPPCETAGAAV